MTLDLPPLPAASAHAEIRAIADMDQGWNFWRDWRHAMAQCCPPDPMPRSTRPSELD